MVMEAGSPTRAVGKLEAQESNPYGSDLRAHWLDTQEERLRLFEAKGQKNEVLV